MPSLTQRIKKIMKENQCFNEGGTNVLRAMGSLIEGFDPIETHGETRLAEMMLAKLKGEFPDATDESLHAARQEVKELLIYRSSSRSSSQTGCLSAIVLILSAIFVPCWCTWAQENSEFSAVGKPARLIPTIKLGEETTLDISGWSWFREYYSENSDAKFQQTNRLNLSLDGEKWGAGAVLDFSYDQRSEEFNENYLLELNGKYKPSEEWEITFGDILKSCGRGKAIEGPHIWPTIGFPKTIPYGNYATGGQLALKKKLPTGDLFASFDLTSRGDVPFNSRHRFDWLESSGLVKYDMGGGSLGAVYEATKQRFSGGFFTEWRPLNGKLFVRWEVDGTSNFDDQSSNSVGSFVDITVRPIRPFALSLLGIFNEQISKSWEETSLVKGKNGLYAAKTETKQSPDETESGVGAYLNWFITRDDSLIFKTGAYKRLGEDINNKSFPLQLSGEVVWRF